MSWSETVQDEMDQIRSDHGMALVQSRDDGEKAASQTGTVMYRRGHAEGWWAAVEWALTWQSINRPIPRLRASQVAQARMLDVRTHMHRTFAPSKMFARGFTDAWPRAILWLLGEQDDWGSLDPADAVIELGKGHGSIYWPLFIEDPTVTVDCPTGHRTVLDRRGICDECGLDFLRNAS